MRNTGWFTFTVNTDTTWRQWLGSVLRILATRLDGRRSLAIDIKSEPSIPEPTRKEIVRAGFERMCERLRDEVKRSDPEWHG